MPNWLVIHKDFWTISSPCVCDKIFQYSHIEVYYWIITQWNMVLFCFLSSSDIKVFYNLLQCHALGINSSLILHLYQFFTYTFAFFRFTLPSQQPDMNNSIRITFINVFIKINFGKIYSKNMPLISSKCNFIKISLKKSISLSTCKTLSN